MKKGSKFQSPQKMNIERWKGKKNQNRFAGSEELERVARALGNRINVCGRIVIIRVAAW